MFLLLGVKMPSAIVGALIHPKFLLAALRGGTLISEPSDQIISLADIQRIMSAGNILPSRIQNFPKQTPVQLKTSQTHRRTFNPERGAHF